SAYRMGFVEDQQGAKLPGELAHLLVKPGLRMDDANIGHHRLSQHAGDVAGCERLFECGSVIKFDYLGGDHRVDRRSNVAAPQTCRTVWLKSNEGFIDCPVIAPIKYKNFGSAGDVPG